MTLLQILLTDPQYIIIMIIVAMELLFIFNSINKTLPMLIFIVTLIIFTIGIYDQYTTINDNIKDFNNNKVLKCKVSKDQLYRVSKHRNWTIDKQYFANGDILIGINKCELY